MSFLFRDVDNVALDGLGVVVAFGYHTAFLEDPFNARVELEPVFHLKRLVIGDRAADSFRDCCKIVGIYQRAP